MSDGFLDRLNDEWVAIMALLPSLPVSPDIEDLIAWHDAEGVARGIGGYSKMEDIHRGTAKALRTLSERVKELEAGIDPFARYGRIHRAMREASARTTMPTRGTLFGLSSVHGDADIDVEDFDRAVALAGDAQ